MGKAGLNHGKIRLPGEWPQETRRHWRMPVSRPHNGWRASSGLLAATLLLAIAGGGVVAAEPTAAPDVAAALARLLQVYPDHLDRIDGNMLIWKDGTRMAIDEGRGARDHETLLATADIKDMFFAPYPPGRPVEPPRRNADPGRARNAGFFNKMYGECKGGGVARNLVDVKWLAKKWGRTVKASRINGVAERLAKISSELDALPGRFDPFLVPPAGTYVCRPIAGTARYSAHSHGIAIDIATKRAHYWRWSGGKPGAEIPYRNAIPYEIVAIFEKYGFIWGGKWYHYDTMHFEYRPELMAAAR
jgi:hypothetical protein